MSFTGEGWGGALVTLSLAGVSQRVEGNARQGAQNHGEGEFVKDEADQEAYAEAEHQAYREGTSRSGRVVVRKFRHERLLLGRLGIFFPPGEFSTQGSILGGRSPKKAHFWWEAPRKERRGEIRGP